MLWDVCQGKAGLCCKPCFKLAAIALTQLVPLHLCVQTHVMSSMLDATSPTESYMQVTGYLVLINIITGAGAIIPAMLIAPTTARQEAKQLMYRTTQVS